MSSLVVKKTVECEKCNAEFSIKHDMSENHYMVAHCCFCGKELDIEVTLDDFVDLSDEEFWNE